MEQMVRVKQTHPDGTATVIHVRESACSGDCHKCSGCGAVEQKLFITAQNPIGAKPGETVRMRTESGPVLMGAAVLYILPLVLFLIGYCLGLTWNAGFWCGLAGFLLGVAAAVVYDRCVARKKPPKYTIVGY